MTVKNPNYLKFLKDGDIRIITTSDIEKALANVKDKYATEGKALIIMMYYTGARPVEILSLRGRDIQREANYMRIQMPGSKKGLSRPIHLLFARKFIKQLFNFCITIHEDMYIFYHYRGYYSREYKGLHGTTINLEITRKPRYYFQKWFSNVIEGGINPYYLRHNRFSKLAANGADLQDIRMLKGARTIESVMPYVHMSTKISKRVARKID